MCVQSSSTALSRSCSSPRAERGAISPSLRDQNASCGTGGLSVTRGIGGSSTLWPRDPLVEPPDVVLLGVARERRAERHHRAHPLRATPAPARARTPRRGSTRRAAPVVVARNLVEPPLQLLDRVGPRAPIEPHLPAVNPPALARRAPGAAPASSRSLRDETRDDQRRRPVARARAACVEPNSATSAAASTPLRRAQPAGRRRRRRRLRRASRTARSSQVHGFARSQRRLKGTRPPSAPAAPWAAARARPRSDGSRAAARGCAGTPARCC